MCITASFVSGFVDDVEELWVSIGGRPEKRIPERENIRNGDTVSLTLLKHNSWRHTSNVPAFNLSFNFDQLVNILPFE